MSAETDFAKRTRSRLWTNRLWLLSGALGAASIASTAGIVHDTGRQAAAARLVARSAAEQAATRASGRLQLIVLETFAPVTPWDARAATGNLDDLARAQARASACACRDTLPADAFFKLDVASGTLQLKRVRPDVDTLATAALEQVALADAKRVRPRASLGVHFAAAAALGQRGIVTVVQADERGDAVSVYGLVGDATGIARTLFTTPDESSSSNGGTSRVPVLDSLSLQVQPEGGPRPIFGGAADDHEFRATVFPTGALQGLGVTAALTRAQAVHSLFISRQELWHLGVLTLATILVVAFAVGSSRREVLLARARSDFIAGVSHDLRMPLAQILIASETLALERERDGAERLKLSSSIVREARRLMSIVDNVLLFSRSGAVALRPTLRPVAVKTLFADVIDAVQLAVDDAGQHIDAADDTSLSVRADRQLLRQALVNLVDNALKYGAPDQHIRLTADADSPSRVRLYVDDEGPGVPAAERTRLFEPYERLSRDQTSERTGTGLGLAVVRHIAQACGGRVWLEASPSGGTRAVLELPAAASTVATETPEQQLV